MNVLTLPASSCPACGLTWHDCHTKRHDPTDGGNCCPGCPHVPDADREADEMELARLKEEAARSGDELTECKVSVFDGALTLDYTLAKAKRFTVEDLEFYVIQLEFYQECLHRMWDAVHRIVALTDPYFEGMQGATMSDVLAVMPPEQRSEVQQLTPVAFPTGYIHLPRERNTGGAL